MLKTPQPLKNPYTGEVLSSFLRSPGLSLFVIQQLREFDIEDFHVDFEPIHNRWNSKIRPYQWLCDENFSINQGAAGFLHVVLNLDAWGRWGYFGEQNLTGNTVRHTIYEVVKTIV